MDIRPSLHLIGLMLLCLSALMVGTLAVDWAVADDAGVSRVFILSAIITSFFGGGLTMATSGTTAPMDKKKLCLTFFLAGWMVPAFAALPFYMAETDLSATDAFFESVSGLTTTGASIFPDIAALPFDILLWRALLQWAGGICFILLTLTTLTYLKAGGFDIFGIGSLEQNRAETRRRLIRDLVFFYIGLTVLCALCYGAAGMTRVEGALHAMATVSSGGFTVFNDSFAHYASGPLYLTGSVFMLISGLPLILLYRAARGHFSPLFHSPQAALYILTVFIGAAVMTALLALQKAGNMNTLWVHALFNVTSVITGTGFHSAAYDQWGTLPQCLFFFLMAMGACAGSASGGIKIFRFQILYLIANMQIKNLMNPAAVFSERYNGVPVTQDTAISVLGFVFTFALCFALLALGLAATGADPLTALSGSMSALANVGPGLGDVIGPGGSYAPLSDAAKWLLCLGMVLGRLEIFAVIVVLTPAFWRR